MTWLGTPLKRSTRRALSIAAVVVLFTYFFAGLLGERFFIPTFLLFILFFLIVFYLNKATGNVALAKDHKLDERQRSLRDHAHRLTYKAFSFYAIFMLLLNMFGFTDLYIPYGRSGSTAIMTLLLLVNAFLFISLPVLYVAWLEPNPPAEDSKLDLTLKGDVS